LLAIHAYIEVADLALGIEFYIVAGRRGLEEEPLASQHPDPGVQESSHLIESGRDGLGRWVAGPSVPTISKKSSLIAYSPPPWLGRIHWTRHPIS
jgi:hypothetical protein